uniref:Uncharacterized protein n=1 Tax=Trichogramma kaykai TaxID=54128 RepID=A0ABD2VWN0_9HYME
MRGHTLLASPPELNIFFRTRCLVPSCECGSRFCRRWQVPNLLCRLHLVSVVLASGATLCVYIEDWSVDVALDAQLRALIRRIEKHEARTARGELHRNENRLPIATGKSSYSGVAE